MANPYDQFDPTSDVKDVALSFGVGANQLLKMAGDAYGLTTGDMDNVVSKQAQENIEYIQRGKSEKLKAAEARRKQATDAEEDTLNKAFTYVRETFTDPRLFLSSTAESAPSMVGAGGIGAGARVATGKLLASKGAETAAKVGVGTAVGAGAGMQGVSTGADQYQQVVDTLQSMPEEQALQIPQIARLIEERGATLEEAKTALALDLARSTGLLSAAASVATQMVPGGRTIEKTLVGGAGRKGAGMALAKRAAGAAVGAAGEGVQEAAEEGSGQFVSNVLARAVEPERELTQGVGEAMGAGFAGAAPLGAAAGAASRPSQSVSEGTQTAGMSDEAPTSAAISPSLEERPTVDLSKAEELNQDQFFAAINVRQANLLGGEPNPEDVKIVGEITSRAQIDPEKANAAISAAQEAVSAWSESNENAPTNIRVIYDPGMAQNGYGIRGAFNRRTGEILINAAYATSPEIVEEVARHEWAHQTLASPDGQKAIADFAAQAIPAEELADLSRRYGTEDKMVLVDEWIANNAEKAPGVIARIVQYIREWLSEFTNGAVKLSPQEAANVLLRTLREQQTGRVEPETVREEGTRMSLEKTPVAERRQEAFEAFKAANPRSDAVMEGGRLYSPAVRNRLKNLLATGEVDRRALDREVERNIPAARNVEIPTEENLPSLEEIRAAVDQSQRSKVGGASNIPAGDSVTVRQDVPAFSRYGVGVVTVQDSKGNKYYQPFVRFTEPVLKPTPGMEKASLKIGAGEAKTPTIVARGKMSEDQSLPTDLDTWTQVGYNPDRHSYMYDRATGRPVTGGSEAVQIGNTVFVKDPEFGEKGDFLYSLAQTKTPEFKKWFGDSKIVEPDGTPTVMYHGTFFKPRETFLGGRTGDFTVFRPQVQEGFLGEKVEGDPGLIFVTPDPEFAGGFAGTADDTATGSLKGDAFAERRPGARLYPLFVKAENPFDYTNDEHIKKLFGGEPSLDIPTGDGRIKRVYPSMLETGRWHLIEPLAGLIKKAGFDGLYVNEQSTKNLAVFSPDQLKSATGNVGAFGQRPLTAEERERVGVSEEAAEGLQAAGDIRFSLEKERTVEDQMKAMTTVKGPLKADSEGFIPSYITDEEALPTVVAGKNKTISVPFVSYNQYANTYFKSKSKDPNYSGKTVSLAEAHAPVIQKSYSGLSAETYLEKDPIKAADMIVNDMAENLLFLHDLATEVFGADVAKRMSKWYDGARVIAEDLAKKYDVDVSQAAAVLACLSPQKHWFANVSLAENVMDVLKNHQETVFDAEVEKAARKSIKASTGTQKSKRVLYGIVREVAGKKLSELSDPDQIAFFTRFLSQYIHPSQAYVVTPEGKLTPGSSVAVAWSGLGVTKNAVAAFLDGSVENLTAALGGGHKVRNFYGNIRDPNSPLFYTSDTHNVAAALLIPVGGSAFEVAHNFGNNPGKSEDPDEGGPKVKGPTLPVRGTKITGLQGTYALYVEAGRRAAEQRGILPRQMQSITWETVRILFPDDTKTSELMAEIKAIHAKVKDGKITLADARNEIVERMGGREGIKARPPEWLNQ